MPKMPYAEAIVIQNRIAAILAEPTATGRTCGRQVRAMISIWPTSRIRKHIAWARDTVRRARFFHATANKPHCWMFIGVARAELARRAA